MNFHIGIGVFVIGLSQFSSFLSLYLYFMTVLYNDTSRYLDDIFTIDNPDFEKHIPDIYLSGLQLNKVNISKKCFTSYLVEVSIHF